MPPQRAVQSARASLSSSEAENDRSAHSRKSLGAFVAVGCGKARPRYSETSIAIFSWHARTSFAQWQCAARMATARAYLLNEVGVEAAGRAVGYDDPDTFTRAFKRCQGLSP